METDSLAQAAALLRERNAIDVELAGLIHRLMTSGHLGGGLPRRSLTSNSEHQLLRQALMAVSRSGPLSGRTVNIKWSLKREGLLDMTESVALDYYLVLTGPPSPYRRQMGAVRS